MSDQPTPEPVPELVPEPQPEPPPPPCVVPPNPTVDEALELVAAGDYAGSPVGVLALEVLRLRVELEGHERTLEERRVRTDERSRLADLFDAHGSTLADLGDGDGIPPAILSALLRLGT